MKRFVAAVIALAGVASAARYSEEEYQNQFTEWMVKFEKQYAPEEIFRRFDTFKWWVDTIETHNEAGYPYQMGLNQFSDLTPAEFKAIYLGGIIKDDLAKPKKLSDLKPKVGSPYPSGSMDWVANGAVTGVKNQGQCGSCWSFSTTGAMEGAIKIKSGTLTSLSEQQLVDCAGRYGNFGCNGGLMDRAFKYCMANGLTTEANYPYISGNGASEKCQEDKVAQPSPNTFLSGYTDVATNENALGAALDQQPVSIAIEADQVGFQSYKSGTFCGICGTNLDHGVLLVGYNTDASGTPYWRVKNSWGTTWGDAGYINMCRDQDECGIDQSASYPAAGSK